MPPKKVTIKTGTGSTQNILVMLTKPVVTKSKLVETKSDSVVTKSDVIESSPSAVANLLHHEDPLIQEYYNSLTPNEKIAHTIAKEKLGTSYDVNRTHGFLRWQKARK